MKKSLIAGLSRIVDSMVTDSNKRLDEYILGSLRKNGLESMANIEEHKDGIRVSLQGYPFAYVDIYLDGEKVVADYSRNAQEVYPGTVKKYAQFAGIPEEQAKSEVEKFYKWMHVLKDHTGGLVDDIQRLKVTDSTEPWILKNKDTGTFYRGGARKWSDDSTQAKRFESKEEAEEFCNSNKISGVSPILLENSGTKFNDSEETEEAKDFRVYVKKSVKDKVRKALAESEYEFEDVGGDYFVVHGVRDFKKFNDYLVSYDVDFMDFLVDEEA